MSVTEAVFDKVLEATVVGSFSRVGYDVRRRLGHWNEPPSMKGRSVLITGATSGLGQATAARLASLGATVRFVAETSPERVSPKKRSSPPMSPSMSATSSPNVRFRFGAGRGRPSC